MSRRCCYQGESKEVEDQAGGRANARLAAWHVSRTHGPGHAAASPHRALDPTRGADWLALAFLAFSPSSPSPHQSPIRALSLFGVTLSVRSGVAAAFHTSTPIVSTRLGPLSVHCQAKPINILVITLASWSTPLRLRLSITFFLFFAATATAHHVPHRAQQTRLLRKVSEGQRRPRLLAHSLITRPFPTSQGHEAQLQV